MAIESQPRIAAISVVLKDFEVLPGRTGSAGPFPEMHLIDASLLGTATPPIQARIPGSPNVLPPESAAKRIFDVFGALMLSILFSPLIVLIALLVRLSGRQVLFRHRRIGRGGQIFNCLKFRTMVPDAEKRLQQMLEAHPQLHDEWTQNHKLRNDPRITRVGRFLRLTSLDELPQFWNVIRGEMSLVGPRPIVRAELLRYGRSAATYLSVRPGLTGLWQIKGRSDTTYRRRVAMDIYYIRHRSLLFDVYVVAATTTAVLRRIGAY